jgi:hypothetical protein
MVSSQHIFLASSITQRCRRVAVVVTSLVILLAVATTALTLEAGQRIAPRASSSGGSRIVPSQQEQQAVSSTSLPPVYSLFDLPRVEQWATERGLRQHHLKIVYNVVMRSAQSTTVESLKELLLQASFPKSHAIDLVSKFNLCSSTLVETRPFLSGGMKLVLRLSSGKLVETVVIRHNPKNKSPRYTVCVSSQVGCARSCSFCATGALGLQAQISSAEILEQVFIARCAIDDPDKLRNVVFMGMYVRTLVFVCFCDYSGLQYFLLFDSALLVPLRGVLLYFSGESLSTIGTRFMQLAGG